MDHVTKNQRDLNMVCINTLDLKNGFFRVPIRMLDQNYLGFCWNDSYYVFQVLPFGLKCSPFYFCIVLRPVIQYMRECNLRVCLYVDDFCLVAQPGCITDHTDFLIHTLEDLGLSINYEKSDLEPNTVKDFIGYTIVSSGCDGEPWLFVPKSSPT